MDKMKSKNFQNLQFILKIYFILQKNVVLIIVKFMGDIIVMKMEIGMIFVFLLIMIMDIILIKLKKNA